MFLEVVWLFASKTSLANHSLNNDSTNGDCGAALNVWPENLT